MTEPRTTAAIVPGEHPIDSDPPPMKVAWNEYAAGVSEHTDEGNARIKEYFRSLDPYDGRDGRTAWCAAFMHWCFVQSGFQKIAVHSAYARDWCGLGEATSQPIRGDVVVFKTWGKDATGGHVGFIVDFDAAGEHVKVLAGNQGNRVSVKFLPISGAGGASINYEVIAWRAYPSS